MKQWTSAHPKANRGRDHDRLLAMRGAGGVRWNAMNRAPWKKYAMVSADTRRGANRPWGTVMKRLLRLVAAFLRLNVVGLMEFRANFLIEVATLNMG
jgi:hypothetical protein